MKKKQKIGVIIIVLCLLLVETLHTEIKKTINTEEIETIYIQEGFASIKEVPFKIKRITDGNKGTNIIEVIPHPTGKKIDIKAISAGVTNLIITGEKSQQKEYIVVVYSNTSAMNKETLKNLLSKIEGIKIDISENGIIVHGKVFNYRDYEYVTKLLENMPDALNYVQLSPEFYRITKMEIKKELKKIGIQNIRIKCIKDSFILEGTTDDISKQAKAERIASMYYPKISNEIIVKHPPAKLIETQLSVLEILKDSSNNSNFNYNLKVDTSADIKISSETGSKPFYFGNIGLLMDKIFPEHNNFGEVLKGKSFFQHNFYTYSGENETFSDILKIPVYKSDDNGRWLEKYEEVGFDINFKPYLNSKNLINVILELRISSPVSKDTHNNYIIKSTGTKKKVILINGQTQLIDEFVIQNINTLDSERPPDSESAIIQYNNAKHSEKKTSTHLIFMNCTIRKKVDMPSISDHLIKKDLKRLKNEHSLKKKK